jgi:hypothetical protein
MQLQIKNGLALAMSIRIGLSSKEIYLILITLRDQRFTYRFICLMQSNFTVCVEVFEFHCLQFVEVVYFAYWFPIPN